MLSTDLVQSDTAAKMRYPSLTFTLPPCVPNFGPRVGRIALTRDGDGADDRSFRTNTNTNTNTTANGTPVSITMDTPNILVGTSRGVVPHFSRDHTCGSDTIRWINVPFESFLEQVPPIPTLQGGPHPLHRFLGFDKDRYIVSLCLRNPLDTREMPPNGNTHVSANCVRGVKKVTLSDWREYVHTMRPDVAFALTDIPLTPPPYSQKRITKSIERNATWLADLLRPIPSDDTGSSELDTSPSRHPLNVFIHMAGGTSVPARAAFAHGLRETLHGPEADAVRPFQCLDDGVSGYTLDLAVLRDMKPTPNTSQHQRQLDDFLQLENLDAPIPSASAVATESSDTPDITSLLKASLAKLSERKLRLVTGTRSPHEMLHLIREIGVDLFDTAWAMHAADIGIALDFCFPAPAGDDARNGRWSLGHNLYNVVYAHQFRRLADTFVGAGESADGVETERRTCPCIACSPRSPSSHILHSNVDQQSYDAPIHGEATTRYEKPYSRAYVHHLLHTHEMSAHTFLVAHNLAIVSAFLASVRHVWIESRDEGRSAQFALEVERFSSAYDEGRELFITAKKDWELVDRARGKGRLTRERTKQVMIKTDGEDTA